MTRKEILAMVRKLIADEQSVGFTEGGNLEEPEGTQELEQYLDRAVDEYSRRKAAEKDARFLATMNVMRGALPEDFIALAGAAPVEILGDTVRWYAPPTTLSVKYWARLPYVTSVEDGAALPYRHEDEVRIAALAAIYALNKHEFNVSQDLMLLGYGGGSNAAGE